MSIRIMSRVLDSPAFNEPGRLLTMLILANYADDDGSNVYPTVATLARKTRQSERTVQRNLKQFMKEGILECIQWEDPIEKKQRRYRIHVGKIPPAETGDMVSPHPPNGCHGVTGRGDMVSRNGCHGVTQTRHVPVSSTRQYPVSQELALPGVDVAAEIYGIYPLKVARERSLQSIRRAIKSFGAEHVLSKTKLFREVWAKAAPEDMQFCPNPTTWFNQNRFNDDPSTWKRAHSESNGSGKPVIDRNKGTFNETIPEGYYQRIAESRQ